MVPTASAPGGEEGSTPPASDATSGSPGPAPPFASVNSKALRSQTTKTHRSSPQVDEVAPVGAMEADRVGRRRRRRRRRQKIKEVPLDNLTRIKRRVKYLLIKMRVEQNLIDAYSGEGWKGQSREKIRPEQELQRAESQILHSKLAIREAIHELDTLGLEGSLDENAFDAEGRIYHEEIFCAKCKSQEALPDNDIILCDGACNRGFHQFCLIPPLATEDIPPGDEGWLCPVCLCKLECIDVVNAYLGTNFEVENSWEEVFAEEAVASAGGEMGNGAGGDWPSSDSEDDDYNPEGLEKHPNSGSEAESKGNSEGSDSSDSGSYSGGIAASSDASSGEDPEKLSLVAGQRKSKWKKADAGCSGNSSGSEDSETSLVDEFKTEGVQSSLGLGQRGSLAEESASDEEAMMIAGKRHRKAVDYKKLHDEMFGNTVPDEEYVSEDEDWGPKRQRRRNNPEEPRRSRPPRSRPSRARAANGTAMKAGSADTSQGVKPDAHVGSPGEDATGPGEEGEKRVWKRLPEGAIEELRRVVAINQLPSKTQKEELSSRLGITYLQVHGWFKNQRHQALRKGLVMSKRPHLVSSTANSLSGVQAFTPEKLAGTEIRTERNDKQSVANIVFLTEKLDEVQLRLLDLKRTLEDFARTTAVVDAEDNGGVGDTNAENGRIGHPANGKRVVYVPVAEVRERPSMGTPTSAC